MTVNVVHLRHATDNRPIGDTMTETTGAGATQAPAREDGTPAPLVTDVRRRNGMAGQFALTATVIYPTERPMTVQFVGNTYGGPIVMVTETWGQQFVTDPRRFGPTLDESWVRRFFA